MLISAAFFLVVVIGQYVRLSVELVARKIQFLHFVRYLLLLVVAQLAHFKVVVRNPGISLLLQHFLIVKLSQLLLLLMFTLAAV